MKGQSALQPGDVIEFQIRAVDKDNIDGQQDPQFAGRYIITKIRHRVTSEDYVQVLQCSKDSVFNAYSSQGEKSFYGLASREHTKFSDIV